MPPKPSNVMKITHTLKADQQFTIEDLEIGEVFISKEDNKLYIAGKVYTMGLNLRSCWAIEESCNVELNGSIDVKQRVTAELILSLYS